METFAFSVRYLKNANKKQYGTVLSTYIILRKPDSLKAKITKQSKDADNGLLILFMNSDVIYCNFI